MSKRHALTRGSLVQRGNQHQYGESRKDDNFILLSFRRHDTSIFGLGNNKITRSESFLRIMHLSSPIDACVIGV